MKCPNLLIGLIALLVISCRSNDAGKLANSGEAIDYDDIPPVVQLSFAGGSKCSGVIVGPSTVLTAAHCLAIVDPSETEVSILFKDREISQFIKRVFVSDDLTASINLNDVVAVARLFLNPSTKYQGFSANEYPVNKKIGGMDLAVIEFERSSFRGSSMMPIAKEPVLTGNLQTVGFGVDIRVGSGSAMKRIARIKDPKHCDGYYVSIGSSTQSDYTTPGDSGGPLVAVDGDGLWTDTGSQAQLLGIVSSGFFKTTGGKWVAQPPVNRNTGRVDLSKIELFVSIFTSLHSGRAVNLLKRAQDAGVKLHPLSNVGSMTSHETICPPLQWKNHFR